VCVSPPRSHVGMIVCDITRDDDVVCCRRRLRHIRVRMPVDLHAVDRRALTALRIRWRTQLVELLQQGGSRIGEGDGGGHASAGEIASRQA
jgi:hypothetical protein